MTPDARRRLAGALMTEQFNRPTPQDTEVVERGGLLPVGTYANGMSGPALPGFIYDGLFGPGDAASGKLGNYQDNREEWAKVGFDTAGAAMVGGLAAPRPRGSIGMSGRPEGAINAAGERSATVRAYRGSNNEFDISQFDPAASNPAWRTNEGALFFGSQDVANFYGAPQTAFDQQLYSSIVKKHTKPDGRMNPQAIAKEYDEIAPQQGAASVMPADINTRNFGQAYLTGYRWDADEGARLKAKIDAAKAQGKDGLIINGMMDASGYPDTQYAVWGRGNVTSPLTGELLYANGGRPGAAVGAVTNALAERPGIRAYHGSPHDFDKFDMSKIGTGEGAQAYGHGLYFAENEAVAQSYKGTGPRAPTSGPNAGQVHYAVKGPDGYDYQFHPLGSKPDTGSPYLTSDKALAERIAQENGGKIRDTSGKMYEVRINASPDDFLDWDKPLSQQSEKVRQAALGIRNKAARSEYEARGFPEPLIQEYLTNAERADKTGGQVVQGMKGAGQSGDFSQALREAGIPGIRYLDQGSRTQGEGSRNYVVFDDNLVEILRKYGLLGMAGGAAANEIMSNPNKAIAQQLMQDDANKYRGAI